MTHKPVAAVSIFGPKNLGFVYHFDYHSHPHADKNFFGRWFLTTKWVYTVSKDIHEGVRVSTAFPLVVYFLERS